MKLGLSIGYSSAHLEVPVALVQRAEELGYDSVWSAEAYGSDAITPLAFLAAKTSRIKLGTGIMQLAAPTPPCPPPASTRWPAEGASSQALGSPDRRSLRGGTASRGASPTIGSRTTS